MGNDNETHNQPAEVSFAEQSIVFDTATKRLKEYDGKSPPLREFIEDLEHAYNLLPETLHQNFINLVLSLLKGAARSCLIGKSPTTLKEITDTLIEYFAPGKPYATYIKEIQSLRIYKDETVTEFYTRLVHLMDLAKASLRAVYNENQAKLMYPQLDLISIAAFKNGVSDKMSYALNILDNLNTLEKVYKKAKTIEMAARENPGESLTPNSKNHVYVVQENISENPNGHFSKEPKIMSFNSNENYNRNSLRSISPNPNTQNFNRSRSPSPRRFDNNMPVKSIMKNPTFQNQSQFQANDYHSNQNYNNQSNFPQNFGYFPTNSMPMFSPYNPYFMPPFMYQNFPSCFPCNPQNYFSNPNGQWNSNIPQNFQQNYQNFSNSHNNPNFQSNQNFPQNSQNSSSNANSNDSNSLNLNATSQTDALRSPQTNQRQNQVTFRENQKNPVQK